VDEGKIGDRLWHRIHRLILTLIIEIVWRQLEQYCWGFITDYGLAVSHENATETANRNQEFTESERAFAVDNKLLLHCSKSNHRYYSPTGIDGFSTNIR